MTEPAVAAAGVASDWRGRVGDSWAAEWRRTDASFAELTPRLITATLADLPHGAAVLDIGCGAGELLVTAAEVRPDLALTGIDIAPQLLAISEQRLAAIGGRATLVCADAASWRPTRRFDAAMSRHGVMFFDEPVAAFANMRALLVSGGQLAFTCFDARRRNRWATLLDATPTDMAATTPGPFAFADQSYVAGLLETAGWHDARATVISYDYHAGATIADAVAMFQRIGPVARSIHDAEPDDRAALIDRLQRAVEPFLRSDGVRIPAAAWLWQART